MSTKLGHFCDQLRYWKLLRETQIWISVFLILIKNSVYILLNVSFVECLQVCKASQHQQDWHFSIVTHTSDDIIVYPITIMDRKKDTASKNRNKRFILDALKGLMDARQFITTLVYKEKKEMQFVTG